MNTASLNMESKEFTGSVVLPKDSNRRYFLLQAGTKVRARRARSSTGTNAGFLEAVIPSNTLQGLGIGSTPSAQLSVYIPDNI